MIGEHSTEQANEPVSDWVVVHARIPSMGQIDMFANNGC